MVAVGMGVLWASYTVGLYGWVLIKGYDKSFGSLFRTTWASPAPAARPAAPGGSAPGGSAPGSNPPGSKLSQGGAA